MSFINFDTKEIQLKVVFYGPQGSGKTAALQHIFQRTNGGNGRTQTVGSSTSDAYYDWLPLKLGDIRGFSTHFQLYTVPGAAPYREARREILEGVDGVVFVADSRPARQSHNLASVDELGLALRANGYDPATIPLVLACGHTDSPDATESSRVAAVVLQTHPQAQSVPVFAMDSVRGAGVFDALKAISKLVLAELKKAG